MDNSPQTEKSSDPPLFHETSTNSATPQHDWGLDRLGEYAREQNAFIVRAEESVTASYWRLGHALNFARRHFSHGQWGKYLQDFGLDKTRATKACAINRTFGAQEAVVGLSVQEAYRRRERKPRTSTPKEQRKKQSRTGIKQWLLEVCKQADFFRDEAACTNPSDAAQLLSAVTSAIKELTDLRKHIQQRSRSV